MPSDPVLITATCLIFVFGIH